MDLTSSNQEIHAELKNPAVMKVAEKLTICKLILKHKVKMSDKLISIGYVDLAARFKNKLPLDFHCDRGENKYLCILILIYPDDLLIPILNNAATLEYFEI